MLMLVVPLTPFSFVINSFSFAWTIFVLSLSFILNVISSRNSFLGPHYPPSKFLFSFFYRHKILCILLSLYIYCTWLLESTYVSFSLDYKISNKNINYRGSVIILPWGFLCSLSQMETRIISQLDLARYPKWLTHMAAADTDCQLAAQGELLTRSPLCPHSMWLVSYSMAARFWRNSPRTRILKDLGRNCKDSPVV